MDSYVLSLLGRNPFCFAFIKIKLIGFFSSFLFFGWGLGMGECPKFTVSLSIQGFFFFFFCAQSIQILLVLFSFLVINNVLFFKT